MIDETVFRGTRLCIVGNICRDSKTAPISPDVRLFQDGETPTESIVETIGGGGANSALFATGLGAETRFAGKVGTDWQGKMLEHTMRSRGVESFICRDPEVQTGNSLVINYTNGCRHFISHQPNNYNLNFSDIDLELFAKGGHFLRADVWFSEQMLAGGNAQLLKAAHNRGLATSLDLNWDPYWGFAPETRIKARKEAVRQILPLVDMLHGNVRELNCFTDSTDLTTTFQRLEAWGAETVVVHMGAQGAGYYCRGDFIVEPSVSVRKHVNTTGSGDLLSVCLMLLHDRKDIQYGEKLRLANHIVADFIEGRRQFLPTLSMGPDYS
ncbi:MAG: carbohydrate kinase family protein [Pirellulales bacterium]|nr:carbohydrate kinase family protein [Pirellulales bacterium]